MFMKKIFSKITIIVEFVSVLIIIGFIIQFNLKTRNNGVESMMNNNLEDINNNQDNDEDILKEIKNMGLEPALGFCENYRSSGKMREEACNRLTRANCSKVSCCAWTNNNQCVAGNKFGPLFTTKGGVKISG